MDGEHLIKLGPLLEVTQSYEGQKLEKDRNKEGVGFKQPVEGKPVLGKGSYRKKITVYGERKKEYII